MSTTTTTAWSRRAFLAGAAGSLAACAAPGGPPDAGIVEVARANVITSMISPRVRAMYAAREDNGHFMPAIPARHLSAQNIRREVDHWSEERPGTIVVDPWERYLYLVLGPERAMRYRIGVGEEGRNFSGSATIRRTASWPTWTPTARMIREEPEIHGPWAGGMPGGIENPLGARALYLYRNGRDTLYRIHGTHAPWSIGQGVSAGCIRLFNHDIIDLYERVDTGARVTVLRESERGRGTTPPSGFIAEAPSDLLPG